MTIRRILKGKGSAVMLIKPNAKIYEAIQKLACDDTSALIVTEDGDSILGIASSSDIVRYLDVHHTFSAGLKIVDVMTRDVVGCEVSETIGRIEKLMAHHKVRHIPITNAGKICGLKRRKANLRKCGDSGCVVKFNMPAEHSAGIAVPSTEEVRQRNVP